MRMDEFNLEDQYIHYCGQDSLRRNEAVLVKKESEMQYLGAISNMTRTVSVHFQGKPVNITVIQVYAPNTNVEEADVD